MKGSRILSKRKNNLIVLECFFILFKNNFLIFQFKKIQLIFNNQYIFSLHYFLLCYNKKFQEYNMKNPYDKYYLTENLFGEPYPELIEFFSNFKKKGKVLDLGCGQGRDAIALSRFGYEVTGIDNSKVGIEQMNQIAKDEKLKLFGQVSDIYSFDNFYDFDIILLDSMFHFNKKDKEKEIVLIKKIVSEIRKGSIIIFCIQDTGTKVKQLIKAIDYENKLIRILDKNFKYIYEEKENDYTSETYYKMLVVEK